MLRGTETRDFFDFLIAVGNSIFEEMEVCQHLPQDVSNPQRALSRQRFGAYSGININHGAFAL
jgi:hypothetical protein